MPPSFPTRRASDLFRADILNGERDPEGLRRAATARGISPDGPYRLLRLRYAQVRGRQRTGSARRRAVLELLAGHFDLDAMVATSIPGGDIILLTSGRAACRERVCPNV